MGLLGDLDHVEKMLRSTGDADFSGDPGDRLAAIQLAVTAALESKLGRSFGEAGSPEQVIVEAPTPSVAPISGALGSDLLLLPKGNRIVTAVVESATWDGDSWEDGTTLDAEHYRRTTFDRDGVAYGLRRLLGGVWSGTVLVTGLWADVGVDAIVPDLVTYAANYLIVAHFRAEKLGLAGGIPNPDGTSTRLIDPWKNELVKECLDRYGLGPNLLVV